MRVSLINAKVPIRISSKYFAIHCKMSMPANPHTRAVVIQILGADVMLSTRPSEFHKIPIKFQPSIGGSQEGETSMTILTKSQILNITGDIIFNSQFPSKQVLSMLMKKIDNPPTMKAIR